MNISNDKKSFYQWETNRFLVDEDFKINQEVCFSSVKLRKALVVKTKLKNNKIVVEVPNLLLQDYHPIMVHWVIADENGKYVTKEQEFQVLKRAKPEDYVYTETEIFSFLDLEQRLKNLEEEGINKAIADYFVKNPIQSGATSEQAAQIIQNKENIEKLNKNKLDADKLPEAINNALTQAEASGAFKGEPGKDGVVPVTGAAVGQTVKVTAVDENGNPTEWEATDFPESSTQTDWNQNDESVVDYIKNRPFYTETVERSIAGVEFTVAISRMTNNSGGEIIEHNMNLPFALGQVWRCIPLRFGTDENSAMEVEVTQADDGSLWLDGGAFYIKENSSFGSSSYVANTHNLSVKIVGISGTITGDPIIHQLDQKYIPNADWSQSDENAPGYIKNKPFYEIPEVVLFDEDITLSGGNFEGREYAYYFSNELPFEAGKTYSVTYDCSSVSTTLEVTMGDDLSAVLVIDSSSSNSFGQGTITKNAFIVDWPIATSGRLTIKELGSGSIKYLDPKYIKDMYYTETKTLSETREFTEPVITDLEFAELLYEHRKDAVYTVEGVNFVYSADQADAPGYAWIVAPEGETEGSMVFLPFTTPESTTLIGDILFSPNSSITVNYEVEEIHHLDPKYIKDMYYEEENLVNIAGLEYFVINPMSNGVTEYTYDYIPLELGQTWDVCYNPSNNDNFTAGDYSSMPVQEDEDGNLYIGDPEVNTYPFYITSNFIRVSANWYSIIRMTVVKIVGVSGTYTDDPIVHQIDTKYLPILEEDYETIFKANVTDIIELRGPAYGKLLGKYTVVIDGVSETVEFIDDGIGSFVETESFFIESWTDPEGNVDNNGFTMEFINQDGNPHSVEIIAIKDVIKEEYLPDCVTAKPDWNQNDPDGAGYIANRTHYDDKNHYLIDGAFVNLDINQLYTVQIYDDIYENVPVYNAGTNNDPRWGVGDMRVVNYPFGFFKYPCWPSNDIINTELSMISFDRNIYPDATINDVQIYQRILKKLDEKYIPDSVKGMLVTVSEDAEGNLVASNNSEEIIAAYEAGVCVRLEYNGLVHDLTLIMENMPIFLCMVPNSQTNIGVYMIVVNADYTINVQEESYNIPTIDATLAIEGAAADAKATGDAISAVSALVGDVAVSEQISSALAESAIPTPTTAQVGQLLSVKAVDENGKPTEWEAVDPEANTSGLELVDRTTGAHYNVYVDNGKLTMEVV